MNLKAFFSRLLTIVAPLFFLVLLEGVLRMFGVAADTRIAFQTIPGKPQEMAFSPEYARRYFRTFLPAIAFNPFQKEKADDTFRVFVLGGSSAAGFPYQFYHGFPSRLEARLAAAAAGQRIEVVNLGMTAVSSYTLWDLKDSVIRQQADAVLIYAGHNEYYGAFGAGTTINKLGNRIWLKRLVFRLKRTVLYTLLERLIGSRPDGGIDNQESESRSMMARVVRDAMIKRNGTVYEAGLDQFEANMRDVLQTFSDANIPVYLATLTSNLKDQPPLGDEPEAVQAYQQGLELLAQGDTMTARRPFLSAKEHDDIRFRAPEDINQQIRTLAEDPNVTLVDVQALFQANSPHSLEDASLFDDHLHPNARGYDLMAEAFFQSLKTHPRFQPVSGAAEAEPDFLIDPFERVYAAMHINRLKSGYPFDKTITLEEETRAYQRFLNRYRTSGQYLDSLAVMVLTSPKTVQEALYDGVHIARSRSDTLTALLLYRSLLHWQPFNEGLMKEAVGYALSGSANDELVSDLALFSANHTAHLYYLNALGMVRVRQKRLDEAAAWLNKAETRDSTSRVMLFNKARLLVLQGDTLSAMGYFERYKRNQ